MKRDFDAWGGESYSMGFKIKIIGEKQVFEFFSKRYGIKKTRRTEADPKNYNFFCILSVQIY